MIDAIIQNAVSGFDTNGISPLDLDIFPDNLHLPNAINDKDIGPKQVKSVEADKNMMRNDESSCSNNKNIKLIIEKNSPVPHFSIGKELASLLGTNYWL